MFILRGWITRLTFYEVGFNLTLGKVPSFRSVGWLTSIFDELRSSNVQRTIRVIGSSSILRYPALWRVLWRPAR